MRTLRRQPTPSTSTPATGRAKDAGMKYMVLTIDTTMASPMFDSKADPYSIVKATPFKRDPVRGQADACRAEGSSSAPTARTRLARS
ncbi:MAG: alpha-L-fucosidase [Kiritimatiellia bacterium]